MVRNATILRSQDARTLQAFMRGMFTHLVTALARSLRELDLNLSEIAALHLIDESGTLRISDLATALAMPMPAASRLADGLVVRGLVLRSESTADRRVKLLTLSRGAAELIERTSRERVQTALAGAAAMPGVATETIGEALHRLVDAERKQRKETLK